MATAELGAEVQGGLDEFVKRCCAALGDELVAVVLYGSGAEGQLRARSDLNVIVVLKRFDVGRMAALRPAYAEVQAGLRLRAMFVEEAELGAAADAFAVKFTDILSRRKVLYGPDVFATLALSREATVIRIKQVLLNQELRLRERYVGGASEARELVRLVGDAAPVLRASALAILHLEGQERRTPSEALWAIVRASGKPELARLLEVIAEARQNERLPEGAGPELLVEVLGLIQYLRGRLTAGGSA